MTGTPNVWAPRTSVANLGLPLFLVKAQSKIYLEKLAKGFGFNNGEELKAAFSNAPHVTEVSIGKLFTLDVLDFLEIRP